MVILTGHVEFLSFPSETRVKTVAFNSIKFCSSSGCTFEDEIKIQLETPSECIISNNIIIIINAKFITTLNMPKDITSSQPRLVDLLSAFLPIVNKSIVFVVTKFSVKNNSSLDLRAIGSGTFLSFP